MLYSNQSVQLTAKEIDSCFQVSISLTKRMMLFPQLGVSKTSQLRCFLLEIKRSGKTKSLSFSILLNLQGQPKK